MGQPQTPLQQLATRNIERLKSGLPKDSGEFLRLFNIGVGQNGVNPPTDEQVAQVAGQTATSGQCTRGNVTHRLHSTLDKALFNGAWPAFKELRRLQFPDGQSFNSQQSYDFVRLNQRDGSGRQRTTNQIVQLANTAMQNPGALPAIVAPAVPAITTSGQQTAAGSSSEGENESEGRAAASSGDEQNAEDAGDGGDGDDGVDDGEDDEDAEAPSQPSPSTPITPISRHGRHTRGMTSLRTEDEAEGEEIAGESEDEEERPVEKKARRSSSSASTKINPATFGKALERKMERHLAEKNASASDVQQTRSTFDRGLKAFLGSRDKRGYLVPEKRVKANEVAVEEQLASSAPATPFGGFSQSFNARMTNTTDQASPNQSAGPSQQSRASQGLAAVEEENDPEDGIDLDDEDEMEEDQIEDEEMAE